MPLKLKVAIAWTVNAPPPQRILAPREFTPGTLRQVSTLPHRRSADVSSFFSPRRGYGRVAPKGVAGPGGLVPGSARWGMCCSNFNKPAGAVSRGSPQFSQKFIRFAGNFRQKRTTPPRCWRESVLHVPIRPPPPEWRGEQALCRPPPAAGGYHGSSLASSAWMARKRGMMPILSGVCTGSW